MISAHVTVAIVKQLTKQPMLANVKAVVPVIAVVITVPATKTNAVAVQQNVVKS